MEENQDSTKAHCGLPVAIVADEIGRRWTIDPAIRALNDVVPFVGRAVTVECVAGDISGVLYGLEAAWRGDVLMIDARAHSGAAIWGELMQNAAMVLGPRGSRDRRRGSRQCVHSIIAASRLRSLGLPTRTAAFRRWPRESADQLRRGGRCPERSHHRGPGRRRRRQSRTSDRLAGPLP